MANVVSMRGGGGGYHTGVYHIYINLNICNQLQNNLARGNALFTHL